MSDDGNEMRLREAQVITTDILPEPAEVRGWEKRGSMYFLQAILQDSNAVCYLHLSPEQARQITVVESDMESLSDPEDFSSSWNHIAFGWHIGSIPCWPCIRLR